MSGGESIEECRRGADAVAPPLELDDTDQVPWSRRDAAGIAWVVVAGIAALVPALLRGVYLGPYDLLSRYGLTAQPGVVPRNPLASDQITQMIPWNGLAWSQVHAGHIPLWNSFSGLGMPLAFNWQSAPFGLPALIGYLGPQRLAYTLGVLVTLVVTGTGAYVCARVLGVGVLGAALAGTGFELAGSTFGWLGWPVDSVVSWTGWLVAAVVVVANGRRRPWSIAGMAVVIAAAIYAGQPDTLILLAVTGGAFALAFVVARFRATGDGRASWRVLVDLAGAGVFGLALAAPLLLPGFQLLSRSVRSGGGGALGSQTGLGLRLFAGEFVGYDGFRGMVNASIGSILVVLAVAGVLCRWRRPAVQAVLAIVAATGLLTFSEPVIRAVNAFPGMHAVRLPRALSFLVFAIVVLAGVGMDALVRGDTRLRVPRLLAPGFALATILFLVAVFVGTARTTYSPAAFVSRITDGFRFQPTLWGGVGIIVGLVGAGVLLWRGHRSSDRGLSATARRVGAAMLMAESVLLVVTATPFWASSPVGFPAAPAAQQLHRIVGNGLVGLGPAAESCLAIPGIGFLPNVSSAYGVRQFALYDPMLPATYFSSWQQAAGNPGGVGYISAFCPVVASTVLARQYGVAFVLESHGTPGPVGAVFVQSVGIEDLYRVPGAAEATLTPLLPGGGLPPDAATGAPTAVRHPSPSVWRITTGSAVSAVLRLHLTDVPGWSATIDGRPLALESYAQVMLQAELPPGRHVIVVTYWPDSFTWGLVLAALAAVGLVVWLVVDVARRRRAGNCAPDA